MKLRDVLILLPVLAWCVSCAGPSFEKAWRSASATYEAEGGDSPVEGPWTGTWVSGDNGHTGALRCIATPVDGSEGRYEFRYHATWAKVFSGGYSGEFDALPVGRGYEVSGSKDLGPFGAFSHEGTIDGKTFDSTFESSRGDYGKFLLKRPL